MIDKLLKPLDDILNTITMYRLMLYYLTFLWISAFILIFLKFFPFDPLSFLFSTTLIFIICYLTNKLFARIFGAITNFESVYISATILALIITPSLNILNLKFIIIASVLASASKYFFAFNKKHIFNPAAIAVYLPSILSLGAASWWIGTPVMVIPVILGGIMLTRKIQRFHLVFSFIAAFTLFVFLSSFSKGVNLINVLQASLVGSSTLFFAFVMLTEPSTTPPRFLSRVLYGALVGVLSVFYVFEFALILGNVFSYILSFKKKLMLRLKKKEKIAPDIYELSFTKDQNFTFNPGQYLEWTISTAKVDSRGNRRYFTLVSSPTEDDLKIGVKVYENGSSFKQTLISLKEGERALVGGLSGDFILPKEVKERLVFIAGGIGVTPFRSMLKYLIDNNMKRQITLFYSNKTQDEIVYKDIFDEAQKKLDIKTVYNLTDIENISSEWKGYKGRLNEEILKKEVPNFNSSFFYLSGPHAMVVGFEDTLYKMGVSSSKIKKDFFPGYA